MLRGGWQWAQSQPCFPMVPADVDSPEFCLGLQTLLSLKVRHPCLDLTQSARTGRRLRVEASIGLASLARLRGVKNSELV